MKDPNQVLYDKGNGRIGVKTINREPSKTQEQFADECDINNIMKKHESPTRFMNSIQLSGQYSDFSQITDYQDMLNTVRYADEAFAQLPADTRLKFRNDPSQLLDFLQDPKNYDEGVKLGLVKPKPVPPAIPKINDDSNDDKNGQPVKTKTKTKIDPE